MEIMLNKTYKQRVIIRRVTTKGNPVNKKASNKKRVILILLLLLLIPCIYGFSYFYKITAKKLQTNNFFNIKEIEVNVTGNYISKDFIIDQSGLKLGDNIFRFSSNELENKLKLQSPEIKEIDIMRWLPDKIKINIEEYTPIGILLYNGSLYKVDANGIIFHKVDNLAKEKDKLPLFSGIKIMKEDIKKNTRNLLLLKAIALVEKIKIFDEKFLDNISEINFEDFDKIIFYTVEEGLKIKVGDTMTREKMAYLNTVLSDIDTQKAKYIDIRFKDKVIVGY